jgi:hypothetical protein
MFIASASISIGQSDFNNYISHLDLEYLQLYFPEVTTYAVLIREMDFLR